MGEAHGWADKGHLIVRPMARAINFRGVGAVVDAYELNKTGPWAVWCQGKILFSSDGVGQDDVDSGAQQLEAVLNSMKKHGSQGVYELWVYKLKNPDQEIDSKTPHFRAFGFSLFENPVEGATNQDNRLFDLLSAMDARLKKLEEEELEQEVEQEDRTIMGKIGTMAMTLIERPEVQQQLAMGAVALWKNITGQNASHMQDRKVAGVESAPVNLLDADQVNKCHLALTRLSAKDAKLGDHLQKLADMAERDPAKYSMALNFL
jgi:hypothetical protein